MYILGLFEVCLYHKVLEVVLVGLRVNAYVLWLDVVNFSVEVVSFCIPTNNVPVLSQPLLVKL